MRFIHSTKLHFFAPTLWRKVFLFKKNPIFKTAEKLIYTRASVVPNILANYNIAIYSGKSWHTRHLTRWTVGYKFGALTWNRKLALYKAKQLKKKKKN